MHIPNTTNGIDVNQKIAEYEDSYLDIFECEEPITLESLASLPQWLAWREEFVKGKKQKRPYSPHGEGRASSTDAATWGTRAQAETRAAALAVSKGCNKGVGIVLGNLVDDRGDTLIGIDLDTCRNPKTGEVASWATEAMARLATYSEVSPSRTGFKAFGLVSNSDMPRVLETLGRDGKKQLFGKQWKRGEGAHPPAVEFYCGERYFAVTDLSLDAAIECIPTRTLLDMIRTEGWRTTKPKGGKAVQPVKRADLSRSGLAWRLAFKMKRAGYTFDNFQAEVATQPETAEWAAEKGEREIQRAWNRVGVLQASKQGIPLSNLANARALLRGDPELAEIVYFDDMQCTAMLAHPVPSYGVNPARLHKGWQPRELTDGDVIDTQEYLQRAGLTGIAINTVHDAINNRAKECRRNPLKTYLESIKHDGLARLSTWLTTYLGATDRAYTQAISRMFLIGMIARALNPGCKADYMLVLEGPQGAGKSTAARILGGEWCGDSLPELGHDAVRTSQYLRGKWVIEIPELSAFGKAEIKELKAFVTRTEEKFTPKYGRRDVVEPRTCVFIGSYNPDGVGPFSDPTGNRRFLPIAVGSHIDTDGLQRDRDQLFAEAVKAYRAGEQWWPDRDFEREHIAPEQEARRERDPWFDIIREHVENPECPEKIKVDAVARAVGVTADRLTPPINGRIARILTELGLEKRRSEHDRWWERML